MKSFRRLLLVLLLFFMLTPSARANDFGAWSPSPGGATATSAYSSGLDPWAPASIRERMNWSCVDERGFPISAQDREYLSLVFLAAAEVYAGEWSFGGEAALGADAAGAPANGGYKSGADGMEAFLSDESSLMSQGKWTPYEARALTRSGAEGVSRSRYSTQAPGWEIQTGEGALPRRQSARIAKLLPQRASTPIGLHQDLPEACGLFLGSDDQPSLQTQLLRPGDFLIDQMLYVPSRLASAVIEYIHPHAFSYTFWTPHTERSDLMWDVPESCNPESSSYLDREQISAGCSNNEVLGWNQENREDGGGSWFLVAAQVLQWIISGVYLLILFAAAVVFMFRGHRAQMSGVLKIVPRIILSILLTLSAGFLIGAGISFSNIAVQSVFEWNGTRPLVGLNAIILQSGSIVGGPDLVQRIFEVLASTAAAVFYAVFALSALARQILLVALVILAPLAAMSLIVPRWRKHFATYARALGVCLGLPVILAVIIKIGMSINPLIVNPEGAYGSPEGFLGLLLLLVTLWLMYRAIRWSFRYTKSGESGAQGALERVRETLLPQAPAPTEKAPTALVPSERVSIAGAVESAGEKISGALVSGTSPSTAGALAEKSAKSTQDKLRDLQSAWAQKNKNLGRRRLSYEESDSLQQGIHSEIKRREEELGRSLSAEEIEAITQRFAAGGKIKQDGGAWYLEGKS